MSYPAISLATATAGRHRRPPKRLQTAANLPSTRIRARIIAPVTPSPPSAVLTPSIPVHRWIRAKVEAPFSEWADITKGAAQKPSESESQGVTAQTNIRQWERQHRDKIRGFRRTEPDLVWQSIPVALVDGNPEKTKVWQSGPAPGLHRGSRYYVVRLDDGQLAWVRVSRNWGNLPAVEGKSKREGLPERNWELEGGRKTRIGNPPRVSQAGYIPLTESGELKPKATAPPKARLPIKEGVDTSARPQSRKGLRSGSQSRKAWTWW